MVTLVVGEMTEAEGDAVVFLDSDDERDKTGDRGKGEEDEVNVEIVIQEKFASENRQQQISAYQHRAKVQKSHV